MDIDVKSFQYALSDKNESIEVLAVCSQMHLSLTSTYVSQESKVILISAFSTLCQGNEKELI